MLYVVFNVSCVVCVVVLRYGYGVLFCAGGALFDDVSGVAFVSVVGGHCPALYIGLEMYVCIPCRMNTMFP